VTDTCEAPNCSEPATHTVGVTYPDLPPESWRLCRAHDAQLKLDVVRSRPKKPPEVEEAGRPNAVRCGACGREIDQPAGTPFDERIPCPDCGSTTRAISAWPTGSLTLHSRLGTKTRRAGSKRWTGRSSGGDSYTHDLEAWGQRSLLIDEETDSYREVIELWDGTTIEGMAALKDHR
jgi:hypothetical protein